MTDQFDLKKYYYERLKSNSERTYFREILNKRLRVDPNTFNQWMHRNKVPGYAEIIIEDIINEPALKLPTINPIVEQATKKQWDT